MILAISDGTSTYSLEGGTNPVTVTSKEYTPARPQLTATEIASRTGDGGELDSASWANVRETVSVVAIGTEAHVRAYVQNVETALNLAAQYASQRRGVPWHLYFDPSATSLSNAYRSQILYGTLALVSFDLENGIAEIEIELTRRFYWEGALTALTLTNGHGSTSYGRTIYNTDDATYDDWVTIDGDDVLGALPTPVRVEYVNAWTSRIYDLITSLAVWGGKDHSAAQLAIASASYSTGSWSGDSDTRITAWDLTSAQLDNFAGRYYRVLLELGNYPAAGTWLKAKVMINSLTSVYDGDYTLLNSGAYYQDLGVIELPPWLRGETGLQPLQVALYARKTGGGSLNVSYAKLLPARSLRWMQPAGYGSDTSTRLVDDQITETLWNEALDGTLKTGHYWVRGGKQYLWPGRDATLYVKAASTSSAFTSDIQGALKVSYRPRRLSL